MIYQKLKKVVLIFCFSALPLFAGDFSHENDTYSLVGFEGGFSSLDSEKNVLGSSAVITKYRLPEAGLKVGAQNEHYRVFLGIHYYANGNFDYMTTYGAELQYMFNFASFANLYLGAGAGKYNMRFLPAGEGTSRTLADTYFSGDMGLNLHVMKSLDLELGARIMTLSGENTIASTTYKFDTLITAYGSVIFKFQMD